MSSKTSAPPTRRRGKNIEKVTFGAAQREWSPSTVMRSNVGRSCSEELWQLDMAVAGHDPQPARVPRPAWRSYGHERHRGSRSRRSPRFRGRRRRCGIQGRSTRDNSQAPPPADARSRYDEGSSNSVAAARSAWARQARSPHQTVGRWGVGVWVQFGWPPTTCVVGADRPRTRRGADDCAPVRGGGDRRSHA